ncbi:protein translocase subunit SecD [Candidatus Formimonas warabiya]|uniref:Protein translocase subunit SecD n=1 Tax=Formimonas warabiya TaxID=1761012 RepID=A0A3G1KNG7_FORW1|nr:protein translocase subunit SecD [Candidatus Formimonas warabiya]ATW23960.1 protein-export membrane protein SecD [Candidatus Formimonas warabiya]
MNRSNGLKLIVVVVALIVAVFLSINPIQNKTKLGLDLQGGAHVLLQAVPEPGKTITTDDMTKLKAVMENRINELGVSEPRIQSEGKDRLIIEIAGVDNPDKAIDLLGSTAKLEFKDPSGQVVVSGSELKNAQARIDSNTGQAEISLEFTSEGAKKFGAATARLVGQPISIVLDDKVIQSPNVQEPIMNGQARITGGFTFEEASNNAALLRGGALPVEVKVLEKRTVGPTLGKDSLHKSYIAGIIGLLAVVVFMFAYYRLPGLLANVALLLYILINLWIYTLLHITMTLPGIAGFLLTIGMALDTNIIIFERVKEELRAGKSLYAAIDSGFKRAFLTVIDAHVTTLIAAAVLFYFGQSSVKGFAVTLSIGILSNLFTAITFTRIMLVWTANIKSLSHRKLYGE